MITQLLACAGALALLASAFLLAYRRRAGYLPDAKWLAWHSAGGLAALGLATLILLGLGALGLRLSTAVPADAQGLALVAPILSIAARAAIEEGSKLAFIGLLLWRLKDPDCGCSFEEEERDADGKRRFAWNPIVEAWMLGGLLLGLVFGFVETVLSGIDDWLVVLLRVIGPLPLHAVSAGILGHFAARARTRGPLPLVVGIVLAVLLHGGFNLMLSFGYPWQEIAFVLSLASLVTSLRYLSGARNRASA